MVFWTISRNIFSFCLINPQLSCFDRKVSVKCSETVVMNLRITGNTFVNIRINSHTLHFHHSGWFQVVRNCWIYLYREQLEKIFGQVGPGLLCLTSDPRKNPSPTSRTRSECHTPILSWWQSVRISVESAGRVACESFLPFKKNLNQPFPKSQNIALLSFLVTFSLARQW